jgi:hypothetical protein
MHSSIIIIIKDPIWCLVSIHGAINSALNLPPSLPLPLSTADRALFVVCGEIKGLLKFFYFIFMLL